LHRIIVAVEVGREGFNETMGNEDGTSENRCWKQHEPVTTLPSVTGS
jgi:hypothetical protein